MALVQILALAFFVIIVWRTPVKLFVHICIIHPNLAGVRLGYAFDMLAHCCFGNVAAFHFNGTAHASGRAHSFDFDGICSGAITATGCGCRSSKNSSVPRRANDILL